jgi:DNA-binding transcriptional regulator LsrR (DeoR family)
LASSYLRECISQNTILGLSWGKSVYNTVSNLKPEKGINNLKVVQIMGQASSDNEYVDARELVRIVSKLYNGKAYYLNSPLYIEDDYARNILKNDQTNANTIRLASCADIILTGIGSMDLKTFNHLWKGYIDKSSINELIKKGVAGYICAYFYDKNGNIMDIDYNKRIVGIDIHDLKNVKTVIGVAGGDSAVKAEAILASLKGKFINVLVTDFDTANELIKLGS